MGVSNIRVADSIPRRICNISRRSGQLGYWTDNETASPNLTARQIRSPAVWTGERYYDPAYARHLSRETYRGEQNRVSDIELLNQYANDPNPIEHWAAFWREQRARIRN